MWNKCFIVTITRYIHELPDKNEELIGIEENKKNKVNASNGTGKIYYPINELALTWINNMWWIIGALYNIKRLFKSSKEEKYGFK